MQNNFIANIQQAISR